MKFKIKRTVLLNALSKVSRAVSMKSPIPSLTGIKFDLTNEGLILTGSDSDITIQTVITKDLDIIETGSVILSSRYILEMIKKIDADDLDIEMTHGTMTYIRGGRSLFELNGTPGSEYPHINFMKKGSHLTIKSDLLKEIIEQTVFATSDKETRPVLTGVNLRGKGQELLCLATDGFRLSQKRVFLDEDVSFNIIIPKKSFIEISRIADLTETVDIYISDRSMLIEADQYLLQTRLIDGAFPDTSRLFANTYAYELSINAAAMMAAIDRASLLSTAENDYIKLSMKPDRIILSSYSQEIGSVEENLSHAFFKGDALTISCSAHYLLEAIRAVNVETITILFNDKLQPFIIRDKERDDIVEVVLPVRTYY